MNIIQNINEIDDYINIKNDIDINNNKKQKNININFRNEIQNDQLNQIKPI